MTTSLPLARFCSMAVCACTIWSNGVRSPAQAATLAAAYIPVIQGESFVARALQTAGVPGFDVVLESVGGSVLASVLGGLAVGGQVVPTAPRLANQIPRHRRFRT